MAHGSETLDFWQMNFNPMKILLVLLAFCLATTTVIAQQDPLYAQYLNNYFVLNPAYAGFTNNLNGTVSYRQQWTGFEGSPSTFNANGHLSLFGNRMGAGLMFLSDKIGSTSTSELYGSYSYRIHLDENNTLSFGLQAGLINFKTNNDEITVLNPDDPMFAGDISERKPNIGSGIIFSNDKFFIGFSVPRMLKAKTESMLSPTLYAQHYYAMGAYLFSLNDRVKFKPSVLAKLIAGAKPSFDINAAIIFHENYTAGLLTRNLSTHGLFLQAFIKNTLMIGYVMEVPTRKSVGSAFNTHEVTIGIRMNALPSHESGSTTF